MRLIYSATSPYVRKAYLVALAHGLRDKLTLEPLLANPINRNDALYKLNPLGKVPCLILDDGRAIIDSRVIAAYFDSLGKTSLHEVKGFDRFHSMTLEALADGLLDAALLSRYEMIARPENLRWQEWLNGQGGKIDSAVAAIEADWMPFLTAGPSIGAIAVAVSLGYLDFRFPEKPWRKAAPKLAAWYEGVVKSPDMVATTPVA